MRVPPRSVQYHSHSCLTNSTISHDNLSNSKTHLLYHNAYTLFSYLSLISFRPCLLGFLEGEARLYIPTRFSTTGSSSVDLVRL